MNRFLRLFAAPLLAVALVAGALWHATPRVGAQTSITSTTVSAAMTAATNRISLTSDSGVAQGTYLYVGHELMQAQSEIGTTGTWTVRRGIADGGTQAAAHALNAKVWVLASTGAGQSYYTFDVASGDACTAGPFLPRINTKSGQVADCEQGIWIARKNDATFVADFTVRDSFDRGHTVMQDDGTAKSLTDAEENFVFGSPLGAIEYREEQAKTVSSWLTINNELNISGDDTTTAEGVEITFGASSDAALNQMVEVGTNGACIAAMITIADISGIDDLVIGFRQNEAFVDANAYETYNDWAAMGVQDTAGDIDVEDEEAGGGVQNDDAGITWADGERRAMKVCISAAGAPSFYLSDASPDMDYPRYNQVATVNTGDPLTAGDGLIPFLSFLISGTDGPTVTVQWVQLTRLPQ